MTQKDSISAYQHCKKIALGHYENFPVGSILVPKAQRPAVWAIYAFARTADDFADENYPQRENFSDEDSWKQAIDAQKSERLAKLEKWRRHLKSCWEGTPSHPIFIALQDAIQRHQIPYELLNNLLIAFERDVTERRKKTWEEVLDYCRYSANPVGRLVLWIFGYRNEKLFQLSDHICTGLQLANFWQDIAVDAEKDRIYVPEEFHEKDRALLHKLGQLTWPFFEQGFELPLLVSGRLAWELKLTWLGGVKILERACANPSRKNLERPEITKSDKISLLMRSFFAYSPETLRKLRLLFL